MLDRHLRDRLEFRRRCAIEPNLSRCESASADRNDDAVLLSTRPRALLCPPGQLGFVID